MIDIHHHCLHGVDDGPHDFEESLDLCRAAADDGIDTIIATPHVLRGSWQNDDPAEIMRAVEMLNDALGGSPRILTGAEYYFGHDTVDRLASGTVPFLADSRYVLIEFASNVVPPMVESVIHAMRLREWVPIIAHPERNQVFTEKDELLRRLVHLGARLQITSGSFSGAFGRRAQAAAAEWLTVELVHFVASDSHNLKKRPPTMGSAYRYIAERHGEERAKALTTDNPAAVVANRPLPYDPGPRPPASGSGFFSRLSRVFDRT